MMPQSSRPNRNPDPEPSRIHAGGRRRAGDGRARHRRAAESLAVKTPPASRCGPSGAPASPSR